MNRTYNVHVNFPQKIVGLHHLIVLGEKIGHCCSREAFDMGSPPFPESNPELEQMHDRPREFPF